MCAITHALDNTSIDNDTQRLANHFRRDGDLDIFHWSFFGRRLHDFLHFLFIWCNLLNRGLSFQVIGICRSYQRAYKILGQVLGIKINANDFNKFLFRTFAHFIRNVDAFGMSKYFLNRSFVALRVSNGWAFIDLA